MKRWISIGHFIIDPEYFNLFYIEHVPSGEWLIFGEDKNQVCWRLLECESYPSAGAHLDGLKEDIDNLNK